MPNPHREFEETRRLLVRALASIKGDEPDSARRYLEHALRLPATAQQKADAYFMLSTVSNAPAEKREHLTSALSYDAGHYRARKALAILDGKLNHAEIINPDTFQPETAPSPQPRTGEVFKCPNCGGRLSYSPDGASLICEYCEKNKTSQHDTPLLEHDVVVGLAKSQGHQKATATQSFECKSCGAVFILPPATLSLTCPHCDSAYTISHAEVREMIPPEGIIPFEVNQQAAYDALKSWVLSKTKGKANLKIELNGIYLPTWTFDFNGEVRWTGYIQQDENTTIPVRDARFIHLDDVFVPASKPVPKYLEKFLLDFHAKDVKPYNPDYTANWLAETYQVSLSDAAVDAHALAFNMAQEIARLKDRLNRVKNLQFTSDGIILQTYKLVLVPVWLGQYRLEGEVYHFLVNGKSGNILADKPPGTFKKFVNWLMEE